jgi:hypothetical protein
MAETPKPVDWSSTARMLERRIRALEQGRRLENSSIGSTGVFQAGATTSGAPVLYLGTLSTVGGGGLEVRRSDGSLAIRVGRSDSGDPESSVALFDKAGNAAIIDSYTGSDGFDRPSFAYGMRPVNAALDVVVNSGSWTDVFESNGRKVNAYVEGRFQAVCSDGTTAAEARLADEAGSPLANSDSDVQSPVGIPTGTTALVRFTTQGCLYPGPVHTTVMTVRLQVRRTSGTGTITVRPGVLCGP